MIKRICKNIAPRWLWTQLRVMRMRHSLRQYRQHLVRHVYGGIPLNIWLADPLGEGWYDHDWPELPELRVLKTHRLKPTAKVFNLGAHQCVVALMLAKIVGPNGLVVAVEANPHNVAVGQRNRDINQTEQLHILHAAIAAQSGTITFNEGLGQVDDGTGEWGTIKVPALSIDELTNRYGCPDLLFIDVEGFEAQALQGAANTLTHRPDCFIEIHVGHGLEKFGGSFKSIMSFFPSNDYECFIASETHREFVSLSAGLSLTKERCFLLALSHAS